MRLRSRYLLAAGVAAAILSAPTAVADPGAACTTAGSDTECSSPGNVQINDSVPVQASPNGVYGGPYPVPWDEGGRGR
ncbi:MAG: hypothetical protein QOH60_3719 [Mycobacterium sp.]|jgi:hypothetical protein|nr:hypothetical protein [Mycobacterium sp.]